MRVPLVDDFHQHLRSGEMMHAIAKELNGVRSCYVMPNLVPPITITDQALAYKAELESVCPDISFYMTLYLSDALTAEEVHRAAAHGIKGIKSYPKGVTTNSWSGIEDYSHYKHIFEAMQMTGLVLNLHGEMPSNELTSTTIMNAEQRFLPQLKSLHETYPRLKIILEHATTEAAVEMVKSLGNTVACTITLHHLAIIVDDWAGNVFNFCKPVAKLHSDRAALRQVVKSGHPRFFFGSDSAPHTLDSKLKGGCAGVFTATSIPQYLAHIFDSFDALPQFVGFACRFGRRFYGIEQPKNEKMMTLVRRNYVVKDELKFVDESGESRRIVPFLAGQTLDYDIASD